MKQRPLWPILPPFVALGLVFLLLHLSHWIGKGTPRCGFLTLTGYFCPGCGGTRCAMALSHGHVVQAFGYNALLASGVFAFSFICLYLIIRITILGKNPPQLSLSPRWIWMSIAIIILFTILRNTATFSWLAP